MKNSKKLKKTQENSEPEGNTKSGSSRKKRTNRSYKWFITINNHSEEELEKLKKLTFKSKYWIIAEETGLEEGIPHVHMWMQFKNNNYTFDKLKKIFPRANIQPSAGSIDDQIYLTKDNKYTTNYEFKIKKEDFQTQLDNLILKEEYNNDNVKWKPWQEFVFKIINNKADKRKIYWFWENEGNVGKSYLVKYIDIKYNVIIAEGKQNDIFNQVLGAINDQIIPKIIILDVPRYSLNYINYAAIEKLKNGLLYSGKYEGGKVRIPIPHVIIFANEEPNKLNLSLDRWSIHEIKK